MKAERKKEIINDIKTKILLPFEYFPHADGLGLTREGVVRIRQLFNMYSHEKRKNKKLSKKYEQLVDELNKSYISKDKIKTLKENFNKKQSSSMYRSK